MKTQVGTLYDYSKESYTLSCLAGKNGFSNAVYWTYLAEDFQNFEFLKGGELIITTGLFLSSGISLYDFIHEIAMKNCSGIIINVGKYIQPQDITQDILDFCNQNKMPLFTMPWHIHLVEIMQDYCRLLLQDSQREDYLSAAFQSSLYQSYISGSTLRTLNEHGFPTAGDYRVMVIQNLQDTAMITSPFNQVQLKYHLFYYDNMHVLIYLTTPHTITLQQIVDLIYYYDGIIMGISDSLSGLSLLEQGYKRARFAFAIATVNRKPYVDFDELGIFQILFAHSNPDLLERIYKKYLGPLEDYDFIHDTRYEETLRFFLLSDCSLVKTSEHMFTHRNTTVYRIRKIKELIGNDFDYAETKFNYLMAFYIKEYLSI